jgi:hypothetical protein
MTIYLNQPGYGTSYVEGKNQFEELLADVARQKGEVFRVKVFLDDDFARGIIQASLIRWEMTGLADEGRCFHHGLSGGRSDHRPSEASDRCRKAAALSCFPAGRSHGGRGVSGLFLRTFDFAGDLKSIGFREVFRSLATKMPPAAPSHYNFLVLDFAGSAGLSFFYKGDKDFELNSEEVVQRGKANSYPPSRIQYGNRTFS